MNKTRYAVAIFASLALAVAGSIVAEAQRRNSRKGGRNSGQQSLKEPFRGISTNDKITEGLFKIESTGVATKPVVDAAKAFLAGISPEQRERTSFEVDDIEWRSWDNRHFYKRKGVGFDEMDAKQRGLAFGLLQASLSAKGLKLSQDIMKLNGTLAELAGNFEEYGEWLYWITVMGEPSETKPWGWQIDGHHLIINYFVLGDQVVMSPVFIGSEPVHATTGKFKGTIVMQEQQDTGEAFMRSLTQEQQAQATLTRIKDQNNAVAQAYKDNINLDYAGLRANELSDAQKKGLLELIETFVGTMSEGHARIKMTEVQDHLDQTYFAWVGGVGPKSVFYYRIHSPVVLIEFDHERRVAPFRSATPTRDHIHAVLRTPNGNDYGKDLLKQHIQEHHSHHGHTHQKSNE
jgi:predicted nuclease of restriction endonuclease-like (RecB) superfamily